MNNNENTPAGQGWGTMCNESISANSNDTILDGKTLVNLLSTEFVKFIAQTHEKISGMPFCGKGAAKEPFAQELTKWLERHVPDYLLPDVLDAAARKRKEVVV